MTILKYARKKGASEPAFRRNAASQPFFGRRALLLAPRNHGLDCVFVPSRAFWQGRRVVRHGAPEACLLAGEPRDVVRHGSNCDRAKSRGGHLGGHSRCIDWAWAGFPPTAARGRATTGRSLRGDVQRRTDACGGIGRPGTGRVRSGLKEKRWSPRRPRQTRRTLPSPPPAQRTMRNFEESVAEFSEFGIPKLYSGIT